jgi:hypothetical protein
MFLSCGAGSPYLIVFVLVEQRVRLICVRGGKGEGGGRKHRGVHKESCGHNSYCTDWQHSRREGENKLIFKGGDRVVPTSDLEQDEARSQLRLVVHAWTQSTGFQIMVPWHPHIKVNIQRERIELELVHGVSEGDIGE